MLLRRRMMTNNQILKIDKLLHDMVRRGEKITALPTAIYARKSTKDESNLSIPVQIETCERIINSIPKLSLKETYSEDKRSGYFIERPEFNKLLEEVKSGRIKVVIAYSLDRISRNVENYAEIRRIFEQSNALLVYATQTFDETADGRCYQNITSAESQKVSELASEKAIRGHAEQASLLMFNGGNAPYGYTIVKGKYVEEPKESPAVRLLFSNYAMGVSLNDIADKLYNSGYATRAGKKFSQSTLYNMLRNERYSGTYLYNDRTARKRKNRVAWTDNEEFRFKDAIPALVDKRTYQKVRMRLQSYSYSKSKKSKNLYPLVGYLYCSCGQMMHGECANGRNKKYFYYSCKRKDGCDSSVSQDKIEKAVAEVLSTLVNKLMRNRRVVDKVLLKVIENNKNEIAILNNKLKFINAEIENAVSALGKASSNLVIDAVNSKIEGLDDQKRIISAKIEDLKVFLNDAKKITKQELLKGTITSDEITNNVPLFESLLNLFVIRVEYVNGKVSVELQDLH